MKIARLETINPTIKNTRKLRSRMREASCHSFFFSVLISWSVSMLVMLLTCSTRVFWRCSSLSTSVLQHHIIEEDSVCVHLSTLGYVRDPRKRKLLLTVFFTCKCNLYFLELSFPYSQHSLQVQRQYLISYGDSCSLICVVTMVHLCLGDFHLLVLKDNVRKVIASCYMEVPRTWYSNWY